MTPPLPVGFGFQLDRETRIEQDRRILWGGARGRVLKLTEAGAREFSRALLGGPLDDDGLRLGRRLVEAGLAHPVPPRPVPADDITVVIPVHDRPQQLERCLAALRGHPLIVVDDGSRDVEAIRDTCRTHDARLVERGSNAGPATARNDGLAAVTTPLVAFLDSDCVPGPDWLECLAGHFRDPSTVAVAPRIRPLAARRGELDEALARYLEQRCPLDLGDRPAAVAPQSSVPYAPTAALLMRTAALAGGFDPALRVGEDVDLVWRLAASGPTVRYDPAVVVAHDEPHTWREALGRRYRYGTSAGPLARRHPGRLHHLFAPPLPAAIVLLLAVSLFVPVRLLPALLALSVLVLIVGCAVLGWRLRRAGIPAWHAPAIVLRSTWRGSCDALRWLVMLYAPVVVFSLARRVVSPWLGLLPLLPYLDEWVRLRPRLDPLRWLLARVADDLCYGAGVWVGCLRSRAWGPLLPALHRPRRD